MGRQYTRKRTTIPKNLRMSTLEALDGRCVVVKLLKGRWTQLTNDLGGANELSYQEQSLCWRLIALESWIEQQEQRLLAREPIDETKWMSALNVMTGMVNRIGIKRRTKPVKSLQEYLEGHVTHETNGADHS